jgi:AcrR family transcriptional regulator
MIDSEQLAAVGADRRSAILSSALTTFARFGYRKTSMDEIARAAHISRPGLYFLFASKEDLFRAAVERGLNEDLAGVERILGESGRPIRERLLEAFDRWAGRYIGPMSRDITAVIDDNPELLGEIAVDMPLRFADLVASAIRSPGSGLSADTSTALAQTLISTSIGIKHQVQDRATYGARLAVAIDLLVPPIH